jgi:glycosyltransferase involved in cell wall biosynthesis
VCSSDLRHYGGEEEAEESCLKILHAGTLGDERSPREFLEALGDVLRADPEMEKKIKVVFMGQNTPFRDGRTMGEYLEQYGLKNVVKLTGFVSRKESLQAMVNSDVLLLIIGKVPKAESYVYGISAKIYDYAFARKPVMTIAEDGASADMARKLGLGCVVDPNDKKGMKEWIRRYYVAFKSNDLNITTNEDLLSSFDYRNLTSKLADHLSDLASS